jgi:hypothetical protein
MSIKYLKEGAEKIREATNVEAQHHSFMENLGEYVQKKHQHGEITDQQYQNAMQSLSHPKVKNQFKLWVKMFIAEKGLDFGLSYPLIAAEVAAGGGFPWRSVLVSESVKSAVMNLLIFGTKEDVGNRVPLHAIGSILWVQSWAGLIQLAKDHLDLLKLATSYVFGGKNRSFRKTARHPRWDSFREGNRKYIPKLVDQTQKDIKKKTDSLFDFKAESNRSFSQRDPFFA